MIVVSREQLLDWRAQLIGVDGIDNIKECMDFLLDGAAAPSEVTQQLIARDAAGRQKYGTTLDRTDLTTGDWLQHMAEELLDGAGYALAAKREWGRAHAPLQGELRQAVAATPWADVPEDKLRRVADVLCDAAPAVGVTDAMVERGRRAMSRYRTATPKAPLESVLHAGLTAALTGSQENPRD